MYKRTISVAVAALLASGCDSGPTADAVSVSAEGDVARLSSTDRNTADLAVEALAEHLNVPIASITVDSVRPVEWRDSSIGCPQPDQAYLQVITPGHRIALRVDGKTYMVHEAKGRAFVCVQQKAVPGSELAQPLSIAWAAQAAQARRDLARMLGVAENQIIIAGADATTFTDTALGCPEPGVEYEKRDFQGYIIRLRHGSREFPFHTDGERVIPCPAISED